MEEQRMNYYHKYQLMKDISFILSFRGVRRQVGFYMETRCNVGEFAFIETLNGPQIISGNADSVNFETVDMESNLAKTVLREITYLENCFGW
jgi:hypothetical protein